VTTATADVAIVGGGPAGAAVAARLARRGRTVVVLERQPAWRWRACGVFASPMAMARIRALFDQAGAMPPSGLARPIAAMRVETRRGTPFRLTYGRDGAASSPPVGFDRGVLDPVLLDLARAAGAEVRAGVAVVGFEWASPGAVLRLSDGGSVATGLLVGADGVRSDVARMLGVARPVRLQPRIGLTFHLADPRPLADRPPGGAVAPDARMILLPDGYVGLAPVPGGRINVGIVLGRSWRPALAGAGAEGVARAVLRMVPRAPDDDVDWAAAERCDAIRGASPLGHAVSRRSGRDWLLVGDAAGFLDPFTGEGLHRALVSAELAAAAVDGALDGDAAALGRYERDMRRRFRAKDAVSGLVQLFLAQPRLFEHAARRLASRSDVRETMGLVMGDIVPASRAVEPEYVARLLAP
jgi:flavin-dependent dehydrogenase